MNTYVVTFTDNCIVFFIKKHSFRNKKNIVFSEGLLIGVGWVFFFSFLETFFIYFLFLVQRLFSGFLEKRHFIYSFRNWQFLFQNIICMDYERCLEIFFVFVCVCVTCIFVFVLDAQSYMYTWGWSLLFFCWFKQLLILCCFSWTSSNWANYKYKWC